MFQKVHIEISNICNVQCSFCPVVERPKDIMSLVKFEKVLKEVVPLTKDVCLHLMGEPLAHPEIVEILKVSQTHKASLQITTNGLLIKKLGDILINSPSLRQINFSLQAFKDNFPDRPLEGYLDPIRAFIKTAFENRPDLYINLRLWNHGTESFSENEDIIQYFEENFSFNLKRTVDVGSIKSKKVFEDKRLYFHFDSRFDWPSPHYPPQGEQGTCQGLRNHFGIHADGTVVPCCLDKEALIDLGNCFNDSVENILNSKRAQDIKVGFENGRLVEDLCQKCTYIKRFKG